MRGSVGVVFGASGDMAGLAAIETPLAACLSLVRRPPTGSLHQKSRKK